MNGLTSRPWLPVAVVVLQALTVLQLFATTLLGPPLLGAGVAIDTGELAGLVLLNGLALLPWWVVTVVLATSSSLWRAGEQVVLLAAPVITAVVLGVAPLAGALVAGSVGLAVAGAISLLAVVPLAAYAVWLVPRLGLRRARRLRG